jgi:lysophospholipase L1-like esterase
MRRGNGWKIDDGPTLTLTGDPLRLDDGKMVKYLDIGSKFLDSDGGLSKDVMPDFLHLSKKGYDIWAEAIKEPLGELLKK